MINNVVNYLEDICLSVPNKVAFEDEKRQITFKQLREEAYKVAQTLLNDNIGKKPIAIFLDNGIECISAMLGVAYSGNFYTPLDTQMPIPRMQKIFDILCPEVIITDADHLEMVKAIHSSATVMIFQEMLKGSMEDGRILEAASQVIDTDILCVLFTSGSTGVPKGVTISHRSVIDFEEWFGTYMNMDNSLIIGSQPPFHFSYAQYYTIFFTLKVGATAYLVPQAFFMNPQLLMSRLHEKNVNTLFWVPSALVLMVVCHILPEIRLEHLKYVLFGGEVMPIKYLKAWIEKYPETIFLNAYGLTEIDTCLMYSISHKLENDEKLPLGKVRGNCEILLLDETDKLISEQDVVGEIYVRGSGLSSGYYKDPKKTAEKFIQNPVSNNSLDIVFRTGDLAYLDADDNYVYVSRKDFQIKHMGYRIELMEIEEVALSIDGMISCCCFYNKEKSHIILCYEGTEEEGAVIAKLRTLLPVYMIPHKCIRLEEIPVNSHGKIDRQTLKIQYKDI